AGIGMCGPAANDRTNADGGRGGAAVKASDFERARLSADEKRRLLERLLRERSREWSGEHELTVGQRAPWARQQVSPESPAYNFAHAFRIACDFDVAALRRALVCIQERHAVLRTQYMMRGDGPVASVARERPLDFCTIESEGCDAIRLREQLA